MQALPSEHMYANGSNNGRLPFMNVGWIKITFLSDKHFFLKHFYTANKANIISFIPFLINWVDFRFVLQKYIKSKFNVVYSGI